MPSPQSHNWCFTLNNPTEDDEATISNLWTEAKCTYVVFGRETAPTTGTPHLQGFVVFPRKLRFRGVKRIIGIERIHLEAARGAATQAATYCKKDGDFIELGTCPVSSGGATNGVSATTKFFEWSDAFYVSNLRTPTFAEACIEFPSIITRHRNILDVVVARAPPPALITVSSANLQPWQQELEEHLTDDAPDDRTVDFFVDKNGGKGKTWFQRFMLSKYPYKVQLLGCGKREDIAHTIECDKSVFLINVPRGSMEFLNYGILEQMKDRLVFSPKYESKMKVLLHKVHLVVFSNEFPDMEKMTFDRYNVVTMDN